MDGRVHLAVEDLFVEAPDERSRLAEAVDQFVADGVTGRFDLDQLYVPTAAFERVGHPPGLPQGEVRSPGRQPDRLCHTGLSVTVVETPFGFRGRRILFRKRQSINYIVIYQIGSWPLFRWATDGSRRY